jgi:hypothetical protein
MNKATAILSTKEHIFSLFSHFLRKPLSEAQQLDILFHNGHDILDKGCCSFFSSAASFLIFYPGLLLPQPQ